MKWCDLIRLDSIDSTNSEALRLIRGSLVVANSALVAGTQTCGRGKLNRVWDSPSGNLFVSFILDAEFFLPHVSVFVAALATGCAIGDIVGHDLITYKWPNDVLLMGKKVAGVLIDFDISTDEFQNKPSKFLVMGIGVNVFCAPVCGSISVAECCELNNGSLVSILHNISWYVDYFMNLFYDLGFDEIRAFWLSKAVGLNKLMTVRSSSGVYTGIFRGISEFGALCLGACVLSDFAHDIYFSSCDVF